jgi:hypothetical protein
MQDYYRDWVDNLLEGPFVLSVAGSAASRLDAYERAYGAPYHIVGKDLNIFDWAQRGPRMALRRHLNPR